MMKVVSKWFIFFVLNIITIGILAYDITNTYIHLTAIAWFASTIPLAPILEHLLEMHWQRNKHR